MVNPFDKFLGLIVVVILSSFLLWLTELLLGGLLLLGQELHQLLSELVLQIGGQPVDFLVVSHFENWDLFEAVHDLGLELFDLCHVIFEVILDNSGDILFLSIILAWCLLIEERCSLPREIILEDSLLRDVLNT